MQRESDRLAQTNSDLIRLLLSDPLTGAGNRKHFDAELNRAFGQSRSSQACMSLLMLDVDRFKRLNDTHGHQAGDAVLVELARRTLAIVGEGGVVCRYGGEEFTVILAGANEAAARVMAEDIRRAVAATAFDLRHLKLPVSEVKVTISLGVAVYDSASAHLISNPQLLLHLADKAMYAAKQAGRNCVRTLSGRHAAAAA
jgi:two-component system cell cycle response regulator